MDITPAVIAAFRTDYDEFANTTTYPDSVVTKALCEGDTQTGSSRWGAYEDECHNFKQRGMFFYAAHWLSTYYPRGGNQTPNSNPTWAWTDKTVRNQSISYDTGTSNVSPGNAWLFSSIYGQQFYRLMKQAALGGVSV